VETPFGWHVLVLDAVEPAGTTPLAEVRGEIEQELKLERARDAVFEVTNGLEDALAGGASLEEAAAGQGLTIVKTPPLARDGTAEGASAVPDSPVLAEAVAAAFDLPAGAESDLEETDAGAAFVVRVDEIVPAALIPFEEARAAVAEAWRADRRLALAKEKAEEAAGRLGPPADAAAIAAELGGTAGTTPALLRDGSNAEGLPRDLLASLFAAKVGDVVTVPTPDGAIAARLAAITPPDPAGRTEGIAAVRDAEDGGIRTDLLAQFAEALTRRYTVEIDNAAIERYYTPG
jgi:peptidyl-prolyl cis-trans isomerase D